MYSCMNGYGYAGPGQLPLPGDIAFSRLLPGPFSQQSQPGDMSYSQYAPPSNFTAGYAGIFKKKDKVESRVVKGEGGYIYRQYSNGNIRVEAGPARVGQTLMQYDAGTQKAWSAVTYEIGTWESYKSGAKRDLTVGILQAVTPVVTSAVGPKGKGKRKKRTPSMPEVPLAPTSTMPEWVLPVGLGAGALVIIGLFISMSKK